MKRVIDEINRLQSRLEKVEKKRDAAVYGSDEHDKLTDERISIITKLGTNAEILKIYCDAAFKTYDDISIPLRMAKKGKFYEFE